MRFLKQVLFALGFTFCHVVAAQNVVHVWEMQELTFTAANSYKNA